MSVTLKDILNRSSSIIEFEVDDLGIVLLKPLTAAQTNNVFKVEDGIERLATATMLSLCDKKGEMLFVDGDVNQVLNHMKFSEIKTIGMKVVDISGIADPKKLVESS